MKNNQYYKNSALDALRGNWPVAVAATIVYVLIGGICTAPSTASQYGVLFISSPEAAILVGGFPVIVTLLFLAPMQVGYYNAFKKLHQEGNSDLVGNIFTLGFKGWGRIVLGQFLLGIFVFLWSLLLLIPGIVKAYAYAMTPYILVDRPDLSANQAINLSCKMMSGHKFDLFYLQLSFIGWAILCLFTLGIGFLWLLPYYATAQAAFYQDVKSEYEMSGIGAGIAA
ncbi:MAG: DUF975 family protein [Bacteroidetes bacterium]|uniref:DUF975 family protein n=1 Tax=Candidatus Cryptobacteroides faecigallinarum TaxID=2840763 RepID=A0A9D9INZ4_9BACT|nr:DUF975 family protein [Candidatus Cryptobacteroides faecigallinarum]